MLTYLTDELLLKLDENGSVNEIMTSPAGTNLVLNLISDCMQIRVGLKKTSL